MNRNVLSEGFVSMVLILSLIMPASLAGASTIKQGQNEVTIGHPAVDHCRPDPAMALNTAKGHVTPMVAAGAAHTVGLKADGTVVAVGSLRGGRCDVVAWTGIVQVAAGREHTVGLKSDGTVVAVGGNWNGECNVGDWTGIVQVAAGFSRTVGLKSDGTAVAEGDNRNGQCNVGGWNLIV